MFKMKKSLLALLSMLGLMSLAGFAQAQQSTSNLFCCNDDNGKRICGDGPRYCWNREYEIVNRAGIVVQTVSRPPTVEERRAASKADEVRLEQEKLQREEDRRFEGLKSLYGTPDKIDQEIERQKLENVENQKIAASRLRTAKENVVLFKAQREGKMTDEDRKTLASYEQTVIAIEQELVNRADQEKRSRDRLLLDKQKLVDYEAQKKKQLK